MPPKAVTSVATMEELVVSDRVSTELTSCMSFAASTLTAPVDVIGLDVTLAVMVRLISLIPKENPTSIDVPERDTS